MKVLLSLLLFTSIIYMPLGMARVSCIELKDDLLSLEHSLMTEKLNECKPNPESGVIENSFCCDKNNPDSASCMTLQNATQEYNEAVADLIIKEGLISLAASIQENAIALKNITAEKIEKVNEHSSHFLSSFDKAKFIDLALNLNKDEKTVLDGYSGNNPDELLKYLESKCAGNQDNSFQSFCADYLIKPEGDKASIVTSMQGFIDSERQIPSIDRKNYYSDYKEYLKIEIDGVEVDLNRKEANQLYADISKIHELTKSDEVNKKDLLSLTNRVSHVKANLNNRKTVLKNIVTKNLEDDIGNSLELHQSMSMELLGISENKNKLDKISNQLGDIQTVKGKALNEEFEKIKNASFSKECAGKTNSDCFQEVKESPRYTELGMSSFENRFADLNKLSGMQELLSRLSSCYDQKTLEEVQKCQKEQLKTHEKIAETSLTEARKKVADAKKKMDFLYQGEPLRFLQLNKMHAYKTYKKLGCNPVDKSYEFQESYCKSAEIDNLILSNKSLGDDVGDILLNMNQKSFDEMIAEEYGNSSQATYQKYRDEQLLSCAEDDNNRASFCKYLSYEKGMDAKARQQRVVAHENKQQAYLQQIERQERIKQERKETRSRGFNAAMAGLAEVTVTSAPKLMEVHMQNEAVKNATENYRQNAIYQQKYQAWMTQQQTYYGDLYSNNPYMNFGWNFYNPSMNGQFNYPNNQYTFYQHGNQFNFSQFNFLPSTSAPTFANPVNPVGPITTPPPGGSTTGNSTTGDFGFQF